MLASSLLLLLLYGQSSSLDECSLDLLGYVGTEDRSGVNGTWNRTFPGSQHLVQLLPGLRFYQRVGIHKYTVKTTAKEQRIRSSNVLGNGVHDVQGR